MNRCPLCEVEISDHAKFCSNCGSAILAELICKSCNTVNPPIAKFCHYCGASLQGVIQVRGLTGLLVASTKLGRRYTILKKLGKGGMGAVYLVTDERLVGKTWAVKELSDVALVDPIERQEAFESFKREAIILATLSHPNLTKVVDYFPEQGKHFLVMDYVDGETLAEKLENRITPFGEREVLGWAEQLCDVLDYLHVQNPVIIFRDLKPGNIMVDATGKVKLIDFGVARIFKPGARKDTMSLGTPGYAAPEQYGKGQSDARTDVYALGATLHHLLTLRDPGDEPFRFPSVRNLNPAISSGLGSAIDKAVLENPASRWQTISQFSHELKTNPVLPPMDNLALNIPPLQKNISLNMSPPLRAHSRASEKKSWGAVTCPNCGEGINRTGTIYCPYCHEHLPMGNESHSSKNLIALEPNSTISVQKTIGLLNNKPNNGYCPYCSSPVRAGMIYCPVCSEHL